MKILPTRVLTYLSVTIAVSALFYSRVSWSNSDPFFENVIVEDGINAGKKLNTSKLRSIVDLNFEEQNDEDLQFIPSFERREGYGYIGNVYHDKRNFIAEVPLDSPQSVDFIYEKFGDIPGGHADLAYHFDPSRPVRLTHQIKNTVDDITGIVTTELVELDSPIELEELIFTAEATRIVGDTSSLKDGGLEGAFKVAYRLASVPGRLFETVIEGKRVTSVTRIHLSPDEVRRSFWISMAEFSERKMSDTYWIINNNCITIAIGALLGGLNDSSKAQKLAQFQKLIESTETFLAQERSEAEIRDQISSLLPEIQEITGPLEPKDIWKSEFFTKWIEE